MAPSRYARKAKIRSPRKLYIAPEGTKTEYQYFWGLKRALRLETVDIIMIEREKESGSSPNHVLALANDYCARHNINVSENIRVALVIDLDRWKDHIPRTFNDAVARKFDFYVSNPCLELWFVLHHHQITDDEKRNLTTCAQFKQLWGELFNGNYDKLYPYTSQAIKNARELDKDCNSGWPLTHGSHLYKLFEFLDF